MRDKLVGQVGELIVAAYLMLRGHAILARNYRAATGEVDIISVKDGYLLAVEVKTRAAHLHHSFQTNNAVDKEKLDKIANTIGIFRTQNSLTLRRLQLRRIAVLIIGVRYGSSYPYLNVREEARHGLETVTTLSSVYHKAKIHRNAAEESLDCTQSKWLDSETYVKEGL